MRCPSSVFRLTAAAAVAVAGVVFFAGCGSVPLAPDEPTPGPHVVSVDESCRLMALRGDVASAVTGEGVVVLAAEGPGIFRSRDGGKSFIRVASPQLFRWPSVTADGSHVWVSWIQKEDMSTAVVAAFGEKLGLGVPALESPHNLIDTELVSLGGGRLLLFVTEVEGLINKNEGTYRILCLQSLNSGLTWSTLSIVARGAPGENLEDPRAVVLAEHAVLLAYEVEAEEGGSSEIVVVRSDDGGVTWSQPSLLWGGEAADREPGGFGWAGRELWFVASTDEGSPGRSYRGSKISLIRSRDEGRSWSRPAVVVDELDQLSMGIIVVDGVVVLPSIRNYQHRKKRFLALYGIDPIGRWRLECGGGADEPSWEAHSR